MTAGNFNARSRTRLRAGLGLVLALLAAPVLALGLGPIQVKSRPGQPLQAEIPIISSDPTELQGLQARLASPDTFRRIGLEPPQGIVSGLQFTPAVDDRGRPVIRVTSAAPVDQAALTFLVEVDWGQGKLVREYSALVEPPRTLAAPVAPPVQAPAVAPAPVIQRPAPPPAVAAPVPAAPPPVPAQPAPTPVAVQPQPEPEPAAPSPPRLVAPVAPAPSTAAAEAAAPREPASGYGPVKRGQTLAQIAGGLAGTQGYSLDQTMLALLRTNPDAFIGQDINRLREGAVLRAPGNDELGRLSREQAATLVREQIGSWRDARRPQAQPAAAAAAAPPAPAASTAPTPSTPRRVADARLEIAPPQAAAGTRAGTQSGATAGGEGDMLRQELQQTKETLAARDAELQELKTRVAELEQLQQQQQDLIALKDSALANAQQRLGTANAAQAVPNADPVATGQAQSGGMPVWWWLLPLVLVLAAVAWVMRRRRVSAADAMSSKRVSDTAVSDAFADPAVVPAAAASKAPEPLPTEPGASAPAVPAPAAPLWVARTKPQPTAVSSPAVSVGPTPTWMSPAAADSSATTASDQVPAGRDRIELARAYADMGDSGTARTLLEEVIANGDPLASEEATRVLQTLR